LEERVLPHVPYRQWTLSFPHRVRWVLLKDVGLLSDVLTVFLRAVFALQRRRARRQNVRGGQAGAVSFIQFFGSALQVTPSSESWRIVNAEGYHLNHPLILAKPSDFKGLQTRQAIGIPSNYGHLRK
jgi:hypothetical protein